MHQIFSNRRILFLAIIMVISNLIILAVSLFLTYYKSTSSQEANVDAIIYATATSLTFITFCIFLFVKITKPLIRGIIEDTNERKLADKKIKDLNILLQSSIESPKGMIIISLDKEYRYQYFNSAFKESMMFSYGKEVKIGMSMLDCVTDENDRANLKENYESALAGKSSMNIQEYGKLERYFYETRYNPIFDNNNEIIGVTVFSINISERIRAEIALQNSEERYKRITEGLTDYLYTVKIKDGKVTETVHNDACLSITGYSSTEISTDPYLWIKMVVPEERELVADRFLKILNGEDFYTIEHRITCKNGTIRWICDTLIPKYSTDGKLIAYDGLIKDITERKQNELLLKEKSDEIETQIKSYKQINEELLITKYCAEENEKQFRQLFENMEQGFAVHEMIYDTENKPIDYRFILINKAFEKLTGILASEFIGKTVKDVLPNTEQVWIENYARVAQTMIPIHFENYAQDLNKYFDVIAYSPKKDFFAVVFTDVTKNKKYEKELVIDKEKAEENEFRLKLAIDSGRLGVWDWNVKDNIMNWEDRMFSLYGIENNAFSNNIDAWTNGLHPEDKERAINECNAALEGRKDFNTTFRVIHPNGKVLHLKANAHVIRNAEGKPLRMIGINRDITDNKLAEEQLVLAKEHAEESDRLKTSFLQNMSHEIRTPMNAIMGFSELLVRNYNNKPKLEKFSGIINHRCNDLLDIINDLLDIAKIESGQLSIHMEECNLNSLFAELTAFFTEHQKRMDKQQITFSLKSTCGPSDVSIITDKVKLKQILINLISNAFKFTKTGTIEGGCKLDLDQNLVFYISDTGIGIPSDKQQMIFERFAQVDHGPNRLYGGTGLGLSIVKGLADLLGGKINVESELGRESTFSFTIPYKTVLPLSSETLNIEKTITYHFPDKTILIVEDDIYNLEYLMEILADSGLNIMQTAYAKEAVEIATSQHIDLVLMDIQLPDFNGYEATRQIKQVKPNLKIIAQTAYASYDEKQKALSSGCNDYISKPTDYRLLLKMINKQLAYL